MSRNFDIPNEAAPRIGVAPPAKPNVAAAPGMEAPQPNGGDRSEEVARLVQSVFLSASLEQRCRAVIFCGIDRGAGCSWVCARSAEILASQTPGRVCVIDANLRSPSLHQHFHAKVGPGFAEAMRESEPIGKFVRSTWTDHLWLMTAGGVGADPNGTLSPARLQSRFAELREEFDFLLIDVPAASVCSDALLIGQLGDGIVLVVASNSTRRDPARVVKQKFDDAKVPILGAVLNKRTYPIPEAVYRRI